MAYTVFFNITMSAFEIGEITNNKYIIYIIFTILWKSMGTWLATFFKISYAQQKKETHKGLFSLFLNTQSI